MHLHCYEFDIFKEIRCGLQNISKEAKFASFYVNLEDINDAVQVTKPAEDVAVTVCLQISRCFINVLYYSNGQFLATKYIKVKSIPNPSPDSVTEALHRYDRDVTYGVHKETIKESTQLFIKNRLVQ